MTHKGWHILLAEPRREKTAVMNLTARGIKAYCPELPSRRRVRRGKVIQEPQIMFPGYLFTPAEDPDWSRIRMSDGVFAARPALLINGVPAVMPHSEMLRIEQKEIEERKKRSQRKFKAGDGVRVTDATSQFYDLLGSVERMDGKDRVRVLMSFFGAQTPVRLKEEQIEAA